MDGDDMLESDLEIRKGILFVRLTGILSKSTVNDLKKVTSLISNNGINKIGRASCRERV